MPGAGAIYDAAVVITEAGSHREERSMTRLPLPRDPRSCGNGRQGAFPSKTDAVERGFHGDAHPIAAPKG